MTPRKTELVVRGGTVVDARWAGPADVFVADGRVQALVEPGTPVPAGSDAVEIDASARLVLPGGVDPHCHVGFTSGDYTSLDGYAQCTTAAVFGGTTTIVDFAIPRPGEQPAATAHAQRAKAAQGLCDSALHGCVIDWDASVPGQLVDMADAGIRTIKMFTTYRGESMADEDTILRVMSSLRDVGGMAVVHCEANHIIEDTQSRCAAKGHIAAPDMAATRPPLAETASVAGVLAIAESVGAPVYFVHQSTPEAVELVSAARRRGVAAFTEAVAHHLILDDSCYDGPEAERFVCCPPLRPRATVEALGRYLITGDITTVGSDHCCYDLGQKRSRRDDVRHMPNGLPGVETRLPIIYSRYVASGLLPITRFVELTSTNPARTNGLYPRKGSLLPGADADIAIWDPSATWTIGVDVLHMATDYTPYERMAVTGRPETVLVRGNVVVSQGKLIDSEPRGEYIPAGPIDLTPAVLAR
ncbi:MAG: D-hydantoinase [Pseudonocardiales bacterium]|nr:D-hydantoinase [Pseudonocardiales bacterium]